MEGGEEGEVGEVVRGSRDVFVEGGELLLLLLRMFLLVNVIWS